MTEDTPIFDAADFTFTTQNINWHPTVTLDTTGIFIRGDDEQEFIFDDIREDGQDNESEEGMTPTKAGFICPECNHEHPANLEEETGELWVEFCAEKHCECSEGADA